MTVRTGLGRGAHPPRAQGPGRLGEGGGSWVRFQEEEAPRQGGRQSVSLTTSPSVLTASRMSQ